uniref:C3H1-type domain-containing protein n=1 Tax=Aegilops tauschii subsp. strangulata TaxID=200361 RepID=A0A453NMV4_AEGTS
TAPATVKTRLCKNHGAPEGCKWGDRCHFAHGDRELGKPMGAGSSFKTRLCVSFVAGGSCAFAGRCHFAHGKDELRRPDAS